MLPLVAIVGRPNVGKSTLFNRIVGGRPAMVADQPGLTRDRHYGHAEHADRAFTVVDTGGFEPAAERGIEALVTAQTLLAIEEADVIVLVWDARAGLTSSDEHVVQVLRRSGRTVICAANKVDGPRQNELVGEFYRLGVDHVFPIAAEHGLGVPDLLDAVVGRLPPKRPATDDAGDPGTRVALVGRPNSGKSALLNRLVGAQRSIVSDEPGTTRDPVDARITTRQGAFTIVDTAGIRRKRRAGEAPEQLAALWSARRIGASDVVCLVIDGATGPTVQDAKIADQALDAGRGLVLVLSKADLLDPGPAARTSLKRQVAERIPFAGFAPQVILSSLTGAGVNRLLPTVSRVLRSWDLRVATAELNRFLERAVADHQPPSQHGRPVRLRYISQPQCRPPTFVIHCNRPTAITEAYRRYLVNRLRETFRFEGVPLRVVFRASKSEQHQQQRQRPRSDRRHSRRRTR